jgi:hypothetical protein
MTIGSTTTGNFADQLPSPNRPSSSSSTAIAQRFMTTQKKKREAAEHMLSSPAYRGSAQSFADLTHATQPPSDFP